MIDDLAEVLLHPALSKEITKILYDPKANHFPDRDYITAPGWDQIFTIITRLYE
jgi:hypothetical protein